MTAIKNCTTCRWVERGVIDARASGAPTPVYTYRCRQIGHEFGTVTQETPIFVHRCALWKRPARSTREREDEAVSLDVGGTD